MKDTNPIFNFSRSQISFGNALVYAVLLLGFLPGSVLATDSPSASPSPSVDVLNEALPILETKYADFKALQYKEGDQLSDLIARSNGKIGFVSEEPDVTLSPVMTTELPGNVLYWRLASFTPEKSWMDVATQLEAATPSATGIILDLRSNMAPDDYHGAAQVLQFFTKDDSSLIRFRADSSGFMGVLIQGAVAFHSPIIVLTNGQTTGAAEALAACLKADGALVIGRATAGKMGVFNEQKLSSGQILRYFVSPICPEDPAVTFRMPHHSLVWNQPVMPDVNVTINDHVEKGALMLIRDNRIQEVIQESSKRDRMSEASLVQGDDPEWDAYLASLEKKTDDHYMSLPPVRDTVLIEALDSLKAKNLSQRPAPVSTPIAALPQASVSVR